MSTSSWNLEINALHNLWNTAYLLWATKDNTDEKLSLWNQSLGFYSWALDKKELAETRENYEYVKKQIQALQNTEEKEQTSSEQEKDTGQKEQKNSSQTGSSSKKSQSSSQRDSQYQLKQWDAKGELSQSEKEYLEGYKQYLEEFQKQNSQFYNKKPSSQEGGDIFENFMNPFTWEPLFQNNFNQSEKDR